MAINVSWSNIHLDGGYPIDRPAVISLEPRKTRAGSRKIGSQLEYFVDYTTDQYLVDPKTGEVIATIHREPDQDEWAKELRKRTRSGQVLLISKDVNEIHRRLKHTVRRNDHFCRHYKVEGELPYCAKFSTALENAGFHPVSHTVLDRNYTSTELTGHAYAGDGYSVLACGYEKLSNLYTRFQIVKIYNLTQLIISGVLYTPKGSCIASSVTATQIDNTVSPRDDKAKADVSEVLTQFGSSGSSTVVLDSDAMLSSNRRDAESYLASVGINKLMSICSVRYTQKRNYVSDWQPINGSAIAADPSDVLATRFAIEWSIAAVKFANLPVTEVACRACNPASMLDTNNIENAAQLREGLFSQLPPLKQVMDALSDPSPSKVVEAAASSYLWHQYVAKTTYSDAKEIIQNWSNMVAHAKEGIPSRRILRARSNYGSDATTEWSGYTTAKVTIRPRAQTKLIELGNVLENTGLSLSLAHAWDLVPYSFVADWFVNVGTMLDAFHKNIFQSTYDIVSCTTGRRLGRELYYTGPLSSESSRKLLEVTGLEPDAKGPGDEFYVHMSMYDREVTRSIPIQPSVNVNALSSTRHIFAGGALLVNYLARN